MVRQTLSSSHQERLTYEADDDEEGVEFLSEGAASNVVDKSCSICIITGEQTFLTIHKHPHLLRLRLYRETNWGGQQGLCPVSILGPPQPQSVFSLTSKLKALWIVLDPHQLGLIQHLLHLLGHVLTEHLLQLSRREPLLPLFQPFDDAFSLFPLIASLILLRPLSTDSFRVCSIPSVLSRLFWIIC